MTTTVMPDTRLALQKDSASIILVQETTGYTEITITIVNATKDIVATDAYVTKSVRMLLSFFFFQEFPHICTPPQNSKLFLCFFYSKLRKKIGMQKLIIYLSGKNYFSRCFLQVAIDFFQNKV